MGLLVQADHRDADVVFLELEERSQIGDFSSVVNSVSVYEFNADDKITFVAVYLQMELPDRRACRTSTAPGGAE